ncbi:MAG: putative toxin-antitoxin system toxin component, PIN family [Coriobacteriia bacterium]|nr:putative toxin-antitoxin system toxin component, PIN family [Coriobacteriia bacterium]
MRIVLDTNVLVSGLLSPFGPPGEILRMVTSGAVTLCVDARLLTEYAQVLARPRFGFDSDAVSALLYFIEHSSVTGAAEPLVVRLPDEDDEPFLEVAIACSARHLVSGNLVHFPAEARCGASVLSPREFLDSYRSATESRDT